MLNFEPGSVEVPVNITFKVLDIKGDAVCVQVEYLDTAEPPMRLWISDTFWLKQDSTLSLTPALITQKRTTRSNSE
jgi:hypothetical protein